MVYEKLPEWRLWLRVFLPSAVSVTGSLVFIVCIVALHLIFLANDPDAVLPSLTGRAADDQIVRIYSMVVQQPLDRVFGHNVLGVMSTALVWGVIGWVMYAVADFVMRSASELRRDSKQIAASQNRVVKHPLHQQLIIRLLWRFTMGLALVVLTAALLPLVSRLFEYDRQLLLSGSAAETLKYAAAILLGWMAVLHLYVVLFRLFLLRTRVFGEIIY